MEYHYNQFFDEIKRLGSKSALLCLTFMTCVSLFVVILCLLHVLPPSAAFWALVWIVPTFFSLGLAARYFHKKAEALAQKQQIAVMAHHTKEIIKSIQEQLPDTYISDCRIKMRFLPRHGIDVDAAMERLNHNVEAYNELVLAFLNESDRQEDTLFDLMQPDTLMQYGAAAHTLRVKANELGIINLTDTAFFHEIEAYAGGLDVIRDNWKKLSFELDEAYDVLSKYIKSVGLKDNAYDKDGNCITLKKWGEQLQEAFNALESYDTRKAKKILSDLTQYRLDPDITNALRGIIAGIDDILTV